MLGPRHAQHPVCEGKRIREGEREKRSQEQKNRKQREKYKIGESTGEIENREDRGGRGAADVTQK